jgi:hypothetical protein
LLYQTDNRLPTPSRTTPSWVSPEVLANHNTKTTSGTEVRCQGEIIGRDVDLCTSLAAMVREHIGNRRSGLLFCTYKGGQLLQTNVLRSSLHPILKKLGYEQGGFNIFRRFRITELQTAECPKPLQHFWSGHAQMHVSERYIKLLRDREYRLEWAEKIATGFELPGRSGGPQLAKTPRIGHFGQLIPFRKTG